MSDGSALDLERFERLGGPTAVRAIESGLAQAGDPTHALAAFERWLVATGKPALHLGDPSSIARLIRALGASRPLASLLQHQPELASRFSEPVRPCPRREDREREAQRVMGAAGGYRHGLDRLRSLRQRWALEIMEADLTGAWPDPDVWTALSDSADVLIGTAADWVWREIGGDGPLNVAIIGFGKLGGCELNYASDVDLVYVAPDGSDEDKARKFALELGRALEDRMGRGAVLRVDLRLRPYGSQGALAPTRRAIRSYYDNYAEPWERLALLRSRQICGPDVAWEPLREEFTFERRVSEATLEGMRSVTTRVSEVAEEDDIKRLPGGIRDLELGVQLRQIVHGRKDASLRARGTIPAIRALADAGLIRDPVGWIGDLTFLRRLEHRIQMWEERQTHALPGDDASRRRLSRLMGLADVAAALKETRERVRERAGGMIPAPRAPEIARFRPLVPNESYLDRLERNEGSRHRLERLLSLAPDLAKRVSRRPALLDAVLTGELEEDHPRDRDGELARWLLVGGDVASRLTDAAERYLRDLAPPELAVFALGSFGQRTMSPESDLDLLLIAPDDLPEAEEIGEDFIRRLEKAKASEGGYGFDLRLRPEGGKGAVAPSREAFLRYAAHDMEAWERLALGSARLLAPGHDAIAADVREVAMGSPLTPEILAELRAMKSRIESERLDPALTARDLKLGMGGLTDLEWAVRLRAWRAHAETGDLPARTADLLPHLLHPLRRLLSLRAANVARGAGSILTPNTVDAERVAEAAGFASREDMEEARRVDAAAIRAALEAAWG